MVKGAKLYVRVFRVANGRQKSVFNKTYTISDYGDFLRMMGELRTMMWGEYLRSRPAKEETLRRSKLKQFVPQSFS
ncbi:MAG: hypothetical protein QXV27_08260 [Candidatus Caldarchaeum sp.]